jgi:hypothetical protein
MRFRAPRERDAEVPPERDEAERVQIWQQERLGRLGYGQRAASEVVTAAWCEGEHTDLVHRIEDLIAQGATLDQAARIAAPVGALDDPDEGEPDAG